MQTCPRLKAPSITAREPDPLTRGGDHRLAIVQRNRLVHRLREPVVDRPPTCPPAQPSTPGDVNKSSDSCTPVGLWTFPTPSPQGVGTTRRPRALVHSPHAR